MAWFVTALHIEPPLGIARRLAACIYNKRAPGRFRAP
jgi:hypothetical protein